MRRAFTLVETVVVVALSVLVLTLLYQAWATSARYSANLEMRFAVLQKANAGLASLAREVERSRRLLYPAPGGEQSALAVTGPEGQSIAYAYDAQKKEVVRHDLVTRDRSAVLTGVRTLKCRVPPAVAGRDSGLVHVTVVLEGPGGHPMLLATSVQLRPLDVRCPVNR
jgi:type II secretory pathway pseudopilin PulG